MFCNSVLWWCSVLQSTWSCCFCSLSAMALQFFDLHCKNSHFRHTTSCLLKWGTLWFSPSSSSVLLPSLKRVKWLKYSETCSDRCCFSIDSVGVCVLFGCVRSGSKGAFSGTGDCDSLSWAVAEQWHRLPSAVGHTWAALSCCAELRWYFCPGSLFSSVPLLCPAGERTQTSLQTAETKVLLGRKISCTNDQL